MAKWRDVKQGRTPLVKGKTPQHSQSSLHTTASIQARLKAFLTDTFLITTPIVYVVMYFIMGSGEAFAQNRTEGWSLIVLIHFSVIVFFWLKKRQTPGLKAYGLKIVSSKNQENPSFINLFIRYFATLFTVISLFLMFIPFARKDKRTFQDIFSNTHIENE